MTRRDVAWTSLATVHLGVLLWALSARLSVEQTIAYQAAATAQRVQIMERLDRNRADLIATQASLATLNQLLVNSQLEVNSKRLLHIEACACPEVRP